MEAISAWAQLVAAVGVVVSLFYLAIQVRQNTRSMRAIVVDSLAKSLAEISRMLAGDLELARAFSAAVDDWHGATDDERTRALFVFQALFKLLENAWFQKRQGTLDPEQWEGWDAIIRVYYHRPGVKAWWPMRRAAFAIGFRDYIENSQPIREIASVNELIRGQASGLR